MYKRQGYSRPHTVHCMPGDNIVISMLGDRDGGGAGGFACLDARTFEVKGRWTRGATVVDLHDRLGREPNARVALELDAARFWDLVIAALERLA